MKLALQIFCLSITTAIFSGCTTGPDLPMYYWGDYPDALYDYAKEINGNLGKDIDQLEKIITKSNKSKRKVPPGLRAHLALLYVHAGDNLRATELFEQEKLNFPYGSSKFVDFQLARLNAVPNSANSIKTNKNNKTPNKNRKNK